VPVPQPQTSLRNESDSTGGGGKLRCREHDGPEQGRSRESSGERSSGNAAEYWNKSRLTSGSWLERLALDDTSWPQPPWAPAGATLIMNRSTRNAPPAEDLARSRNEGAIETQVDEA
jgi:hypothetical protein